MVPALLFCNVSMVVSTLQSGQRGNVLTSSSEAEAGGVTTSTSFLFISCPHTTMVTKETKNTARSGVNSRSTLQMSSSGSLGVTTSRSSEKREGRKPIKVVQWLGWCLSVFVSVCANLIRWGSYLVSQIRVEWSKLSEWSHEISGRSQLICVICVGIGTIVFMFYLS